MFAVGVGKAVEDELREIASEPVDQHLSYSADFNTLPHIVDNIKLNICPGKCWRELGRNLKGKNLHHPNSCTTCSNHAQAMPNLSSCPMWCITF